MTATGSTGRPGAPDGRVPPPERGVYRGELLAVGTFRCPVDHPAFHRESMVFGGHLIVFPRTSVVIAQAGRREAVADPTVAVLYNDRQAYSRRKLSDDGDRCDFFRFAPRCVAEAITDGHADWLDNHDHLFARPTGPVDADLYLAQRRLLVYLQSERHPDRLAVEEAAMTLLGRVVDGCRAHGAGRRPSASTARDRRHRTLAEDARARLAERYCANDNLASLAGSIGCSEYHLSRVFREQTGMTLASYRNELRLRSSLERVADSGASLTDIALDLGYSSHSHFAASFRRLFGLPPSRFRSGTSRLIPKRLNQPAPRGTSA